MADTSPQEEKVCNRCLLLQPITNFTRHPRLKDGYFNQCKECRSEYDRAYREKNREALAEKKRIRMSTEEGRAKAAHHARLHRKRNPQKVSARVKLEYAVKIGKLERLPCQYCGDPNSQAHHEDYADPLNVLWACRKCHIERFHRPTAEVNRV